MSEILNIENLELYKDHNIQMIVEFFYEKFVNFLYTRELPIFVCKTVVFIAILFLTQNITYYHDEGDSQWPIIITKLLMVVQVFLFILKYYLNMDKGQLNFERI